MAKASDIKSGNIIYYNGELVQIIEYIHRTPGNLRAFYQAKMRNIRTGKLAENRFRPDEEVDVARVETNDYQYLYDDGESLIVMDSNTFDQIPISKNLFGNAVKFITEGMMVQVSLDETGEPVMASAPTHVELEVTYTEPAVKGDTTSGATKYATLETGMEVRVPLFINQGDKLKIDTRTEEYVERVNK